jgi:hypothetical protein
LRNGRLEEAWLGGDAEDPKKNYELGGKFREESLEERTTRWEAQTRKPGWEATPRKP